MPRPRPYSEWPAGNTAPVQDTFPAYKHLPWNDIKLYLDRIFPDWNDYKERRAGDQWTFEVPRSLSSKLAEMDLPVEFQRSCLNHLCYPRNLLLNGLKTHHYTLERYQDRLDEFKADLCLQNEKDILVPIRDLYGSQDIDLKKCNIHTEEKLDKWLGFDFLPREKILETQNDTVEGGIPKCRFIYIHAEHSRDQLRLTHSMLTKILTFYQVMPEYLDFMFVFGAQCNQRDLRFSNFLEQTVLYDPPRGLVMPGRSGRQFQLCYSVKGVTQNEKNEDIKLSEWSIRPAAVFHQFDVVYGTTLWIVTKGRLDLQQRYKSLTGPEGRKKDKSFDNVEECFRSSLATHLMFCHWSTEDWRWYIRWLEDVIDIESSIAVYGTRGPGYTHQQYNPCDIQDLQHWKDKVGEAAMVLESNIQSLAALRKFYIGLQSYKHFPLTNCEDDIDSFSLHIERIMDNIKMQISRIKFLETVISDRKELILQHLQGQASDRAEQLNIYLKREAIVMRIITMVTLFYLPATFVSTFFSAEILQFKSMEEPEPGTGVFIPVAMIRWLEVTIPLTVVTICVSWFAYKNADRIKQPHQAKPKESSINHESIATTIWHVISFSKLKGKPQSPLPLHNEQKQMTWGSSGV